MKNSTIKAIYTLILILMAGTAYGQSNLPAWQGSDDSKWSYCFGTYTETQGSWKGDKYVGEFSALGVFHGKLWDLIVRRTRSYLVMLIECWLVDDAIA